MVNDYMLRRSGREALNARMRRTQQEAKMKPDEMRVRFWIQTGVAVAGATLFVVTLFSREWIEFIFHIDPDGGSGALEIGISLGLLVVAALFATLARKEWRLAQARQ